MSKHHDPHLRTTRCGAVQRICGLVADGAVGNVYRDGIIEAGDAAAYCAPIVGYFGRVVLDGSVVNV